MNTRASGPSRPRRRHLTSMSSGTTVLWKRDLLHFIRQPARIAGFIGSPLIFWIVIGSGFSGSFAYPGSIPDISYLEYYYPGTIVLTMLFTAIFASISIIDDRNSGFLQGVMVAPVAGLSIAAGKILAAATLALLQALILLTMITFVGISLSAGSVLATIVSLSVLSVGLAGLGFLIAWRMETTQGFHAVMNLVLIPLWLMSGALFPVAGAASWMATLALFNPLYYGMAAFRQALYLGSAVPPPEPFPFSLNLLFISVFSLTVLLLSIVSTRKTSR